MEERLIECVHYSLQNYLMSNAIFFAERLHAHCNNEESLHVLAMVYYRAGKPQKSRLILRDSSSSENKYLHALCCYEMGKMKEAETILLQDEVPPNGAAGYFLLAQVMTRLHRKDKAVQYLHQSLQLNPFLWSAYESLCLLGEDVDTSVFDIDPEIIDNSTISCTNTPFSLSFIAQQTPLFHASGITPNQMDISTKSRLSPVQNSPYVATKPPKRKLNEDAPKRKVLFQTPENLPSASVSSPSSKLHPHTVSVERKVSSNRPINASNTKRKSWAPTNKTPHQSSSRPQTRSTTKQVEAKENIMCTPVLQNPSSVPPVPNFPGGNESLGELHPEPPTLSTTLPQQQAAIAVLTLLKLFGNAWKLLCNYRCREALDAFKLLPENQFNTGWVMCQLGRAYYELVDYPESQRAYQRARELQPYRTEGMEIYSTVLWHMRKEVELSYLAKEMLDLDKMIPETWCVVGNAFSLQKEHQSAIKFFQRAIEVDPNFTYGNTLCGHEYIASDDLDKALSSFRTAIRMDPRHYNAWGGIGMIFLRQEKYELAEYHFARAIGITQLSSVLYCYLGMVLQANKKLQEALDTLNLALELNPKNTLAKFKRASVLVNLEQYQLALNELVALRDIGPKEAPIYYLIGKIYKKLGRTEEAILHYTTAMDLNNKNVNHIKAIIDKLNVNEGESDEEDDGYEHSLAVS